MSAHAESHPLPSQPHHGNANEHPPPIHYSSRINPVIVGIFLFIGSEIMLFGSFFTVYFFDRVVNSGIHHGPWPPYIPGTHIQYDRPWFAGLVNTCILVTSSFTPWPREPNSAARDCISAADRPSAAVKTASWLPPNRRAVKTSTVAKG